MKQGPAKERAAASAEEAADGLAAVRRGARTFALLLFLASIYKLGGFFPYSSYEMRFQHLPEEVIPLRFAFSISLRIFGLGLAIGLWRMKELARKGAIGLGIFTILTLPWKHPVQVFVNIAPKVEEQLGLSGSDLDLANSIFPYLGTAAVCAVDLIFYSMVLSFMANRHVKTAFRSGTLENPGTEAGAVPPDTQLEP